MLGYVWSVGYVRSLGRWVGIYSMYILAISGVLYSNIITDNASSLL
jgi:hypothetical protein